MTDVLMDLLKKTLGPFFDNLWNSLVFFRILSAALIIAFIAYIRFGDYFTAKSKKQEKDINRFDESDKILNEIDVISVSTNLNPGSKITDIDILKLDTFVAYFELSENEYYDKKVMTACNVFLKAIETLLEYTKNHFFPGPHGGVHFLDTRAKTEDRASYEAYRDKVHQLDEEFVTRHREYRKTIRNRFIK